MVNSRYLLTLFAILVTSFSFQPFTYAIDAAFEHSEYDQIEFDSNGDTITGYFLKAKPNGKTAAAVLLPACGGILHWRSRKIFPFYRDMVSVLTDAGVSVMLIDSLSPRDEKQLCSTPAPDRSITFETRRNDGFNAMFYLRTRDDIIKDKIFLVTYGANGSIDAMNKKSDAYKEAKGGYAGAILFYPHCGGGQQVDFSPYAPVQVFIGEDDAWNPPGECRELAQRVVNGSAQFNLKVYPDTLHGFVWRIEPKMFYKYHAGPVMVGANYESAEDAYKRTTEFVTKIINQ